MAYYQEAKVKLSNTQLNKLKSATKIRQENKSRWRIAIWIISNDKTNNENKKMLLLTICQQI